MKNINKKNKTTVITVNNFSYLKKKKALIVSLLK